MAIGKNKQLGKSKKGGKGKKIVDPFKNKQKFLVRAPGYFSARNVGATIATKTTGNKLASDNLKGRVFSVSLADLKSDESQSFRLIKLRAEEVQDVKVLTNFNGMTLTSDKLKSLVRKWQTLIETIVEVKTADNYVLRVFVIAFTQRKTNQAKKTYYAQSSQVRQIRKKISDLVRDTITPLDLNQAVEKFLHGSIEKAIESATRSVYPLTNVFLRKVKVLKTPKFDLQKLLDTHNESLFVHEDKGTKTVDPKAKGDKKSSGKKEDQKDGAKKRDGPKKDGDKKFGDKKFGDKKFGDKKFGDKKDGAKKFGDKKDAPKKTGDKKDAGKAPAKTAGKSAAPSKTAAPAKTAAAPAKTAAPAKSAAAPSKTAAPAKSAAAPAKTAPAKKEEAKKPAAAKSK